jgi:hypothetical protein
MTRMARADMVSTFQNEGCAQGGKTLVRNPKGNIDFDHVGTDIAVF